MRRDATPGTHLEASIDLEQLPIMLSASAASILGRAMPPSLTSRDRNFAVF